jgi:hypothetical protein
MRTGVTVCLSPTDRKRLQAIVDDRNSPQKHFWRTRPIRTKPSPPPIVGIQVLDSIH